jgi:hypothetical protein
MEEPRALSINRRSRSSHRFRESGGRGPGPDHLATSSTHRRISARSSSGVSVASTTAPSSGTHAAMSFQHVARRSPKRSRSGRPCSRAAMIATGAQSEQMDRGLSGSDTAEPYEVRVRVVSRGSCWAAGSVLSHSCRRRYCSDSVANLLALAVETRKSARGTLAHRRAEIVVADDQALGPEVRHHRQSPSCLVGSGVTSPGPRRRRRRRHWHSPVVLALCSRACLHSKPPHLLPWVRRRAGRSRRVL